MDEIIGFGLYQSCGDRGSVGSPWPACPKNGKLGPHCWGRGGSTQFALQLESAVTALPLVGCVVWSHYITINKRFRNFILQVKGYPGADGGGDHVAIGATLRMKPRMLKQKKSGDKLETHLLRTDDKYKEQYQQIIAKPTE